MADETETTEAEPESFEDAAGAAWDAQVVADGGDENGDAARADEGGGDSTSRRWRPLAAQDSAGAARRLSRERLERKRVSWQKMQKVRD